MFSLQFVVLSCFYVYKKFVNNPLFGFWGFLCLSVYQSVCLSVYLFVCEMTTIKFEGMCCEVCRDVKRMFAVLCICYDFVYLFNSANESYSVASVANEEFGNYTWLCPKLPIEAKLHTNQTKRSFGRMNSPCITLYFLFARRKKYMHIFNSERNFVGERTVLQKCLHTSSSNGNFLKF